MISSNILNIVMYMVFLSSGLFFMQIHAEKFYASELVYFSFVVFHKTQKTIF